MRMPALLRLLANEVSALDLSDPELSAVGAVDDGNPYAQLSEALLRLARRLAVEERQDAPPRPVRDYAVGEWVLFRRIDAAAVDRGIVTRCEEWLRTDNRTGHRIEVAPRLHDGSPMRTGVYSFEDGDEARIAPDAEQGL